MLFYDTKLTATKNPAECIERKKKNVLKWQTAMELMDIRINSNGRWVATGWIYSFEHTICIINMPNFLPINTIW